MKPFLLLLMLEAILFFSCNKNDENAAPLVNFTFTGSKQYTPDTVIFHNLSLNATSYLWDFGDGETSTLENPTHVYASGGSFTVTLTATSSGASESYQQSITIKKRPIGFTINSITIKQFPNKKPNGNDWDNDGRPDIYVAIGEDTSPISYFYVSPTDFENATSPGNYYFPLNVALSGIQDRYWIAIYDRDGLGTAQDDLIGEIPFEFVDYGSGLEMTNGSIDLIMLVTWQY